MAITIAEKLKFYDNYIIIAICHKQLKEFRYLNELGDRPKNLSIKALLRSSAWCAFHQR